MSNDPTLNAENLKTELRDQKEFFVLYLDDEPDLLDSIGAVVQELGFTPLLTTDPSEALLWIQERRGDLALVISDLRMPGLDGFAFREAVSKIAPEIPFAILSAHIDTETALRGVDLKICGFISKPINEVKFLELACREGLTRVRSIKEDRELRAGFISESEGLLLDGESILLAIDESPKDTDSINRFFGIVHTLKGASSFFEPKTFHRMAHRYEDLLKKLQRAEIEYSPEFSEVLFRGFDLLKELFGEFNSGIYKPRDLDALLASIDIGGGAAQGAGPQANTHAADVKDAGHPPAGAPGKAAARSNEDVKVSVVLLDEFMQLSGEVTVIRNMLNKCVRAIERQYSGDRDVAMVAELLNELHKINGGVQNKISEIRKVSVKSVIKAIPRAVRDVSKLIGKHVELEITGDDLRVDTAIAEVLNNSLLHIVKNSMDHGLETPEKRKKAGKAEKGHVFLRFSTSDDKVVVEIEDDGQGINVEAIKSKLVKNGTHTVEQANALPNPEIYAMIFASGFSTAAQVTDISGRGVGMSMVKDSVDAMGGEIQIESNPGVGAKFRLVLPVPKSVLIASCLSVRSGGQQVGLIQDDILRVLQFDEAQVKDLIRELSGDTNALIFEGELIPLARLRDLMGVPTSEGGKKTNLVRRVVVMHSAQDGRRVAIEVDEVLDVEDTVIKGIHPALNPQAIYRGITFLDDGTLGLIVSTTGVLDALKLTRAAGQHKKDAATTDATNAVESTLGNTALLISLAVSGHYALRLGDIHRIEEIQGASIRQSGIASVIPYRGGVLEIRDLGRVFETSDRAEESDLAGAVFPIVVVRRGERLLGLRVKAVMDTVPFTEVQEELSDPAHAIEGHFFSQDRTITLLSLEQVIARLERSDEVEVPLEASENSSESETPPEAVAAA